MRRCSSPTDCGMRRPQNGAFWFNLFPRLTFDNRNVDQTFASHCIYLCALSRWIMAALAGGYLWWSSTRWLSNNTSGALMLTEHAVAVQKSLWLFTVAYVNWHVAARWAVCSWSCEPGCLLNVDRAVCVLTDNYTAGVVLNSSASHWLFFLPLVFPIYFCCFCSHFSVSHSIVFP